VFTQYLGRHCVCVCVCECEFSSLTLGL